MPAPERPECVVILVTAKVYDAVAAIPGATMWFATDAGPDTIPIGRKTESDKVTLYSIKRDSWASSGPRW